MPIRNFYVEKCNGCGICVACCPMDVLRLDKKTKKAVVKYPDDCVAFCPQAWQSHTSD